ncbi:hypothetical protein LguiA_016928 [Lonicera macranthoides]
MGLKMYGKKKNTALTAPSTPESPPEPTAPLPPESRLPARPPPARHAGIEPSARENLENEMTDEGEGPSDASEKDDDGGPLDKSVLISFKDHIAYAIWNKEEATMVKRTVHGSSHR